MTFGKVLPQPEVSIMERITDKLLSMMPKRKLAKPVPKRKTVKDELNELGHREADLIEAVFNERGLDGVFIGEMFASPIAGYIRYHITKPTSVPVNKITALQTDIAIELTKGRPDDDDVQVNIRLPSLVIEVEYPFARQPLSWEQAPIRKLQPGECIIGRDYSGTKAKPVTMDLSSNEVSNIMIAALPGSGKSQAAVQMVASAAINTSPDRIKFLLLDPKCSKELKLLGQLRHAAFYEEHSQCVEVIHAVRAEIEKRKHNDDRRTIVLVIDELAEFCSKSKDHADLIPILRSIARMGRSFGIKIVAATQYPMVDATDSELRAMLDARLGGHVGSETQSRVCMDVPGIGCETLPKRGAFYYKDGDSKVTRINTHYLPYEQLFDVVDEANERWLDDDSFFHPQVTQQSYLTEPETVIVEAPVVAETVDGVTPEQLESVLAEWPVDQLINRDTGKMRHGMGAKVLRHVFGPNVKLNNRPMMKWKIALIDAIK